MIVSLGDLNAHLGFTTGEDEARDTFLEALLTRVESAFLGACGRSGRPFAAADASPRTDVYDGTGSPVLVLDAPVATLLSVVIGADPASPRETVAVAQLAFRVGSILLRRRDGWFGALDEPAVVHVTYTPAAEDLADARLAILRAAAALYYQRGAEDVRSESEGGVRSELAAAFEDPSWTQAVATHYEPRVG